MGHKTLIGGTAYDVTGGRCLVGGTGYAIQKGRTLIGGTGYDVSFGTPIGALPVGSIVMLNVGGVPREFLVVHHGNPDPNVYDATCDGTWLLMKDIYGTRNYSGSSTSVYRKSQIHAYLTNTVLPTIDPAVENAIKQVNIPYVDNERSNGVYNAKNASSTGQSCKLFILSAAEYGFTDNSVNPCYGYDGVSLDYFSSGDAALRIALLNNAASRYYTRTPPSSPGTTNTQLILVNASGGKTTSGSTNYNGLRFALIMQNEFEGYTL